MVKDRWDSICRDGRGQEVWWCSVSVVKCSQDSNSSVLVVTAVACVVRKENHKRGRQLQDWLGNWKWQRRNKKRSLLCLKLSQFEFPLKLLKLLLSVSYKRSRINP